MLALTGTSASTGVAVGRVHRLMPNELAVDHYRLEEYQLDGEVQRFHQAIRDTQQRLDELVGSLQNSASAAREFIDTHRLLLNDQELINSTVSRIKNECCNAEWALTKQRDAIASAFAQFEDPYLRTRIEDIEHVVQMILQSLQQGNPAIAGHLPGHLNNMIIVSSLLSPAEVAVLHDRGAIGIILEQGSAYAHSAILARGLGLPVVTGVSRALNLLHENEEIIIDGHHGAVFLMFEDSLRKHYNTKQAERHHQQYLTQQAANQVAVSSDGETIRLMVNADRPEDIQQFISRGADGVGLMRTEHILLQANLMDEDQQYRIYRAAITAANGAIVTIRTLDAGGDKMPLHQTTTKPESEQSSLNPALGLRAVRLSLHQPELFKNQLRAILRAAARGPTRLLIPMVTQASEIRLVKRLINLCCQELQAEGLEHDPKLQLGAMIEVPAAALAIYSLLPEVDFISIGTNDLAQYTLAADRLDPEVSYLHDPLHPGFLQLLQWVITAAQKSNKDVSLCGEIASDPRYTRILLGLGLRELSMHGASISDIRQEVIRANTHLCQQRMAHHLKQPTLEGIQLIHYMANDEANTPLTEQHMREH